MWHKSALLALVSAACAAPAAAATRPAQPLADIAPQTTAFLDRVGAPTRATGRVAGDSPSVTYSTADGETVSVRFSRSYTPDPAIAQSYVDFLAGLPHGTELNLLKIYIATGPEVQAYCGGADGTLACYDPSSNRMTVPGEQIADDGSGVTTSYVIAHEYGHHIAAHRSNAPFPTLSFGPKFWSSEELVCLNTIRGRLAPGDEGDNYLSNPGEAWADAYAHLHYPDVGWQFTPLLRPDAMSRAAALRDVLEPWAGRTVRVFRGTFAPGGPRTRWFRVRLRLDGSLRIALRGPRETNLDIGVSSLGRRRGSTSRAGSRDVFRVRYACREFQTERVSIAIRRRHGFGPFTVRVTYAG